MYKRKRQGMGREAMIVAQTNGLGLGPKLDSAKSHRKGTGHLTSRFPRKPGEKRAAHIPFYD